MPFCAAPTHLGHREWCIAREQEQVRTCRHLWDPYTVYWRSPDVCVALQKGVDELER